VSMSCGRARRLLWPDAGPREATADIVGAREHASECEACGAFLQDIQRIAERIGRTAPRPTASAEVRDRLFKAIARARTASAAPARSPWVRRPVIASAAGLLLAALGLLGYLTARGALPASRDAIGSIVEDRLRSQKSAGLVSSDSLQVAGWLAERLPFAVQVPLFPEARLTGARLLVENQKSGAVMEYMTQGRLLTYYVLPGGGAGLPRQVQVASRDGYRVASWHDGGLTHALVATLPGARLIEYARYCIHQMMAGLVISADGALQAVIPSEARDLARRARTIPGQDPSLRSG
jgi:anti-sigma factor RsiW